MDNTVTAPADEASAKDKQEHDSTAAMALSHIVLAVSDELLYLITECETSKAAWDKLQAHFERDSLAYHLFLNKKYL